MSSTSSAPSFEALKTRGWLGRGRGDNDIKWDYRSRIANWIQSNRLKIGVDYVDATRTTGTMYDPQSLDREYQKDIARKFTEYRGYRVLSSPPADAISMELALKQFHISPDRVLSLGHEGKLVVGVGKQLPLGKREIFVSHRSIKRYTVRFSTNGGALTVGAMPADGVPVDQIARELDVKPVLLRRWCGWKIHPGLGRQIKHGHGAYTYRNQLGRTVHHRGLLVSRDDASKCVATFRKPEHKQIGDNPGQWLTRGVFQHCDGRLYYTRAHILEHHDAFGLKESSFNENWFKDKVKPLSVIWPGTKKPDPRGKWRLNVYAQLEVEAASKRREGKIDGGRWLVDNEIWQDADGLWFASLHICRQLGIDFNKFYYKYHTCGILSNRKTVTPKIKTGKQAGMWGGRATVYHESQVRPLLGVSNTSPVKPRSPSKGGRPRSELTAQVQEFCYQQYIGNAIKAPIVRRDAERKFGPARAPKSDAEVTILAHRWAKRQAPPLPTSRKKP
jgi:hypothetical protein